jgi:hypothetical protein
MNFVSVGRLILCITGIRAYGGIAVCVWDNIYWTHVPLCSISATTAVYLMSTSIKFSMKRIPLLKWTTTLTNLLFCYQPFLLVGEFNAYHFLCGSAHDEDRSSLIQWMTSQLNLALSNDFLYLHTCYLHMECSQQLTLLSVVQNIPYNGERSVCIQRLPSAKKFFLFLFIYLIG